ncbi:hypothetical protein [Streptomyces sp. NBC_00669]|uniref:hypothetical protein n=1 Tax=Streptomyces sp. NBC_00669 TaxID=2976011 RepID=UPI003FA6BDD4
MGLCCRASTSARPVHSVPSRGEVPAMQRWRIPLAASLLFRGLATPSAAGHPAAATGSASSANPLRGTSNGGNTFPGADTPFGMVRWGRAASTRPPGGDYACSDNVIAGFGLTPGTSDLALDGPLFTSVDVTLGSGGHHWSCGTATAARTSSGRPCPFPEGGPSRPRPPNRPRAAHSVAHAVQRLPAHPGHRRALCHSQSGDLPPNAPPTGRFSEP